GEASRNPCEGHPDQRAAKQAARINGGQRRETPAAFCKSAAAALRVASFMLPSSQQRQFEVHRFRETIVTARFAMGQISNLAELSRENAPLSTIIHIQLADRLMRRLAPSTRRVFWREPAGRSASVRNYNGRQNVDRRDPPGGNPCGGAARQSRRGIRLRERQPQAASR